MLGCVSLRLGCDDAHVGFVSVSPNGDRFPFPPESSDEAGNAGREDCCKKIVSRKISGKFDARSHLSTRYAFGRAVAPWAQEKRLHESSLWLKSARICAQTSGSDEPGG